MGPRPSTRPGEPRVAGPGLVGRGRTRDLSEPRTARATTALTPCWPSPPATSDVGCARAEHRSGRRPLLRETVFAVPPGSELKMDVPSITIRHTKALIEAIPDADWTPVPYWMDGAADVAETTYTPLLSPAPHRCGSSSVPNCPLRHLQLSRLHHRPGRRDPGTGGRPPPPRRDLRDLKYGVGLNHMPFRRQRLWRYR